MSSQVVLMCAHRVGSLLALMSPIPQGEGKTRQSQDFAPRMLVTQSAPAARIA